MKRLNVIGPPVRISSLIKRRSTLFSVAAAGKRLSASSRAAPDGIDPTIVRWLITSMLALRTGRSRGGGLLFRPTESQALRTAWC